MNNKKRLDDVQAWPEMYVALSQVWRDLTKVVYEFLLEAEHAGQPSCSEISSRTCSDIPELFRRRKRDLYLEFAHYLLEYYQDPDPGVLDDDWD